MRDRSLPGSAPFWCPVLLLGTTGSTWISCSVQLKGVPIGIGEQMMEALSRGNTRVDIEKKEDWSVISQSSFL